MYPKNAASPPRIAIGPVVNISDGAVQTSGCSVSVTPEGGAEDTEGNGTVGYLASGVVTYIPTQTETNYTAFLVTAYKTGCIPAAVTVVTTDTTTAGRVNVSHVAGTSQTGRDLGGQLDATISTRAAAATALTNATWTDAKAGYLDQAVSTKRAVSLASADVTGNLPADVKAYTVQPTVTGATLSAAYDAAKTAATQASVDVIDAIVDIIVGRVIGTLAAGTHLPQTGDAYGIVAGANSNAAIKANVDAVKAKTDSLVFTTAGRVDASVMDKTGFSLGVGGIAATAFEAGAINEAAIGLNAIGHDEVADGALDNAKFAADVTLKADVRKINNTTLTGNGSTTPWGPA